MQSLKPSPDQSAQYQVLLGNAMYSRNQQISSNMKIKHPIYREAQAVTNA